MKPTDRREFVKAIAALAATFRTEATEALLEGYWLGLEDLDVRAVKSAAVQAMRSSKFMPAVVELRELTGEAKPEHRAVLAWEAVRRANERHGYYHSVNFDDPVINASLRAMGGWEAFDDKIESDGWKWLRHEFEKTYAALCHTGISGEMAAPLVGFHDRTNAFNGFDEAVKGPTLIETGLPPHGQEVLRLPPQRSRRPLPKSQVPVLEYQDIGRIPS